MDDSTPFSSIRFPDREVVNNIASLRQGMAQMPLVLQRFGFEKFRDGQADVVASILCERDTLCILPTGQGKSFAFIAPTLAMQWRTLVFSPLVALMRDQVQKLWAQQIAAAQMSSTQSEGENTTAARRWMAGELQLLYVAPERMRNEWFKQALTCVKPDMIVVDEAHCLSQWADNFRPDYTKVGDFIRDFPPKVVSAFTATCPPEVEQDIRRVLCMQQAHRLVYYPRRANLKLKSRSLTDDVDVTSFVESHEGQGIVYCTTIKKAVEMTNFLSYSSSTPVGIYHGELKPPEKRSQQDDFMEGKTRVIVATNAFGMGVDKANIRFVCHRNHPGSLEALSQEVGRAGRDGNDSECMTFFDKDSTRTQEFFIAQEFPAEGDVRKVFAAIERMMPASGTMNVPTDEISRVAGVHKWATGAAMSNLVSAKVIERSKPTSKSFKLKPLRDLDKQSSDVSVRLMEFWHVARELGVAEGDILSVDCAAFEERVGLGQYTVRKYFNAWTAAGLLHFEPPPRGGDIKLLGGIDRVEFERLARKRDRAYEKLTHVLRYQDIPDGDAKHEFLEGYFKTGTVEE